jgi:O-6-methylguanine DNA methyltransferase
MDPLRYASMDSPIGTLWLAASEKGLVAIEFDRKREQVLAGWKRRFGADAKQDEGALKPHIAELEGYFAGALTKFHEPIAFAVGTPFQQKSWKALTTIPYGETRSYRWLAEKVGSPKGYRAVGMANHHNPIPIIVPCHRVVQADGTLGGYGGGLDVKRKLLRLEGALPN